MKRVNLHAFATLALRLGFASKDFGGQEPGNEREIGAFCRSNYGVEFPMFSKVRVKGPELPRAGLAR